MKYLKAISVFLVSSVIGGAAGLGVCFLGHWLSGEAQDKASGQPWIMMTMLFVPAGVLVELAKAGWAFSAYQAAESWHVWAKHPLGGATLVADFPIVGRTGFDVAATAAAVAEFLNRKDENASL